jgi:hypothetical protein
MRYGQKTGGLFGLLEAVVDHGATGGVADS